MTLVELPLWASVIAASFFSSLAAVALVGHPRLLGRVRRLAQPERHDNDEGTVLLFDGEFVVDATPKAMDLLSVTKHADVSWGLVSSFFEQRFPGFVEKIKALSEDDSDSASASLESGDGSATFTASLRSGTLRIEYFDQYSETPARSVEQRTLDAMERELDLLRATTEHCPFLVWCQSHDGEITWANRAYLEAAEPPGNDAAHAAWPPPMAFDFQLIQSLAERGGRTRIAKKGKDSEDQWYDCHAASFEEYTLFTAIDVNATVAAERQLRDFMQTLTKTFAHLTVGLAIFDKERRLALFNPALKELTALQIDFLTTRPTLLSFLDRLRDKRMLPEPKDYRSWRQEIAALEAAAAVGTYMQTWTLPNGRTYRVTGRPHADGAIAFLFEDISAEISLTRRFRSELELGQAVVDAMDDGSPYSHRRACCR